jgi:hypothetical protein
MTDHKDIQDKLRKFFKIQGKGTIKIHPSGVVDVDGHVRLSSLWDKLPVKFGKVSGAFICSGGRLTTLEGCPTYVGDNFDCSSNMLTSLAHAPTHVVKDYRCSDNQIISLEHAPKRVDGYFNCGKNQLTNLTHAPEWVQENFTCHGNPLESLAGMPAHVGKAIWLTYDEQLPLLRTLVAEEVQFMNITPESEQVSQILNKYMGQGKVGALKAAAELVKHDFKANARW